MNNTASDPDPALVLNGQAKPWPEEGSVKVLLESLGATGLGVAVELNGRVVPRGEHAMTMLRAGDRVEVVRLVGGG